MPLTKDGKYSSHIHNWANRSEPHSCMAEMRACCVTNAKHQFYAYSLFGMECYH